MRLCRIENPNQKNKFHCRICDTITELDKQFDKAECCGKECTLVEFENLYWFHRWGESYVETSEGDLIEATMAILEHALTHQISVEFPQFIVFFNNSDEAKAVHEIPFGDMP